MRTTMRSMIVSNFTKLTCIATLGLLTAFAAFPRASAADDVHTDPVGFYFAPFLSNSDTYVSIPFDRNSDFLGTVQSVAGNKVTVSGTPGWTGNQWKFPANSIDGTKSNTFFCLFRTGAQTGFHFTVASNDTSSVFLTLDVAGISTVAPGDNVSLIPFWTFNTLSPGGAGVNPSPSPLNLTGATLILIPNFGAVGINKVPAATYFFNGGIWRLFGNPGVDHGNDTFLRDGYFIARQTVPGAATQLIRLGWVPMTNHVMALYTQAGGQQDNYIGLDRPADVTLNQSGFSAGSFVDSASALNVNGDTILVFDNTLQKQNKSPTNTYFHITAGWRKFGAPGVDFGSSNVFLAGQAAIVRKVANPGGTNIFWTNPPNYSN